MKKCICIKLDEEVSSVDKVFNIDGGDVYFLFRICKVVIILELGDGESFIFGGLISSLEREVLKKILFIGDIFILGVFFCNVEIWKN